MKTIIDEEMGNLVNVSTIG